MKKEEKLLNLSDMESLDPHSKASKLDCVYVIEHLIKSKRHIFFLL